MLVSDFQPSAFKKERERDQQTGLSEILLDFPRGIRIVPAFQVPGRLKTLTRLKGEARVERENGWQE